MKAISNLGFTHVDLLMMENWAHINPSELTEDPRGTASSVEGLLKRFGLKAVAINANFSVPLSSTDEVGRERIKDEASGLIRFARRLEIPVIVLQPGKPGDDPDSALRASFEALHSICEQAAKFKIVVAIETHSGSLAESYDQALNFVTEVPGLKLAYDPSHFVMGERSLRDSNVLLPYTAHVHLRNAVKGNFQAPMDSGALDFMWVFEALDGSGYQDAVAIEYLDNRDGTVIGDVTKLKKLLETRYGHV